MKKIKVSIIILGSFIILFPNKNLAQDTSIYGNQRAQNFLYGELGFEPGEFFGSLSINYERTLYDLDFVKFNGRAGLGFWFYWTDGGFDIPVTLQTIFFQKASHLEIGGGTLWMYDNYQNSGEIFHLLNIGYRYHKPERNFIFRFGINKTKYVFFPYIALGYAF